MASKKSKSKLVIVYNLLIGLGIGYIALALLWRTMDLGLGEIGLRYILAFAFVLAISPVLLWGLEFALYHCWISRSLNALLIALALVLSPYLLYFLPWEAKFLTPLIVSGALLLAALPMLMLRRHRDKQMHEEMLSMERL
jgi:hypothetical protein